MSQPLPLLVLGGTTAVLAAIVVVELLPHRAPAPPPASSLAASDANSEAAPDEKPEPDRNNQVSALLARPPFSPSRRPEHTAATQEAAAPGEGMPRLAGIFSVGSERHAIFAMPGQDDQMVVAEGGQLAGWTVRRIAVDAVTIDGPEGSRTLETAFDPNAKPAAPAMPPRMTPSTPAPSQIAHPPTPAGLPGRPVPPNRVNELRAGTPANRAGPNAANAEHGPVNGQTRPQPPAPSGN